MIPTIPVITKFFANKIESSRTDWPDYLLEIANIFAEFDGEEFDRERILERFQVLSGRSSYSLRDGSNFRDEFGAYGTFLGVYHIERVNDRWVIVLSGTARQFLCNEEPDVEAFCRMQLSLFQYPNGGGAAFITTSRGNLSVRTQSNILNNTLREVTMNLRFVPVRMACRALLAKASANDTELQQEELQYQELLALANDDRTNTNPNASDENILEVLDEVARDVCPSWIYQDTILNKFKRNFHIFTYTGLFIRTENGLSLRLDTPRKINMVRSIANMETFFPDINECITQLDPRASVSTIIGSSSWGRYYDAANLPGTLLTILTDSHETDGFVGPLLTTCAISGEKTLPVLEASHIKPYSKEGPHLTSNGLLLRKDFHTLFDRGYLTINEDLHIEVSKKIKDHYGNGRDYYLFHGKQLKLIPENIQDRPSSQFLRWHNENVYLA